MLELQVGTRSSEMWVESESFETSLRPPAPPCWVKRGGSTGRIAPSVQSIVAATCANSEPGLERRAASGFGARTKSQDVLKHCGVFAAWIQAALAIQGLDQPGAAPGVDLPRVAKQGESKADHDVVVCVGPLSAQHVSKGAPMLKLVETTSPLCHVISAQIGAKRGHVVVAVTVGVVETAREVPGEMRMLCRQSKLVRHSC